MRGKIAIVHVLFLITNLFVLIDFWQTRQTTDQVTDIQQKVGYNTNGSTNQPSRLYEISTNTHTFTVPEKHIQAIEKNSTITIHCTPFLGIVRRIEVNNHHFPVFFELYAAISLAVVVLATLALSLSKHHDFQLFAATINVLMSLMVIYMIWF